MRIKTTLILLAFTGTLLMAGCCTDCFLSNPNTGSEYVSDYDGSVYLPLVVGNTWFYRTETTYPTYTKSVTIADTMNYDSLHFCYVKSETSRTIPPTRGTITSTPMEFGNDTLMTGSMVRVSGGYKVQDWSH